MAWIVSCVTGQCGRPLPNHATIAENRVMPSLRASERFVLSPPPCYDVLLLGILPLSGAIAGLGEIDPQDRVWAMFTTVASSNKKWLRSTVRSVSLAH